MDVKIIRGGTRFAFAFRISTGDNTPMLSANLYVSPTNNINNRNNVPPMSMESFRLLRFTNAGVDVIRVITANHADSMANIA